MTWYGKEVDPGGGTSTTANWCRGHSVPASTIGGAFTTPQLASVRFYGGTTVTGDCLIGVFQGGTVGDPDTGTFLGEAYFASPSASQWNEAAISGGPVNVDVDDVIWCHLKANGSVDVRYDSTSGEAEDWYSVLGRYVSTAVSSDPTDSFANDDPWPTDGGSHGDFWYFFGIELVEGGPPTPTVTDVDHGKLYPGATGTVAGTNFGASQGDTRLYISPSATWALADAVEVYLDGTWTATSIPFVVRDLKDPSGNNVTGDTFFHVVEDPTGTPVSSNGFAIVSDYPDHQMQLVEVAMLTSPGTATATFDKTPRIIWVATVDTDAVDAGATDLRWSLAFLQGSTSRSLGLFSDDGSDDWSRYQDDTLYKTYGSSGGGFNKECSLTVSGKDVELDYSTAAGEDGIIYVLALCSDTDLIDVAVGDNTVSSGAITGLSFQPDCIHFACAGTTFNNDDFTHGIFSWGMATDDDEACLSLTMGSPADPHSLIDEGVACTQLAGDSYTWTISNVTMTSGGCTWDGSNADEVMWMAFRLNGVRCGLGVVTNPTGTAPVEFTLPDFGWVPQGLILLTASEETQATTGGVDARMSIGFWEQGLTDPACMMASDRAGTGITDRRQQNADQLLEMGDDADAPAKEISHRGLVIRRAPVVDVTVQDGDADYVLVLAIEEVSPRKHEGLNAGQSIPL